MSNSKQIEFQSEQRRQALEELEREIGTLQSAVQSDQGERKATNKALMSAYIALADVQAQAEAQNSADLARQVAKKQAEVSRLEEKLSGIKPGEDEQRLSDLCLRADVMERERQRLFDRLGWAVLSEAEAELHELERRALATKDQAEQAAKAVETARRLIPGKVADWPEVRAAAIKKYVKPSEPPKVEPSPTAKVLRSFVQFASDLEEYGPQAENAVRGINVGALCVVTPDDLQVFIGRRGGAGNGGTWLPRHREQAEALLRQID